MGQMTSNPKDESLIASEYFETTYETFSVDATRSKVRLIKGQGLHVAILFAGDLTKQEATSPHFG
jgi:hypothetical protein